MSKMYFNKFKIFWHSYFSFSYSYPKHSNFIRISVGWLKITIYQPRPKKRYRCKRCLRDKFDRPYQPHICNRQFRKHHFQFEEIIDENKNN